MEIDYVIQPNGVSIFCPRLKDGERFIGFDKPAEFGANAILRLRARNKVLNLPLLRAFDRLKIEDGAAEDTETKFPEASKMPTIEEEPTKENNDIGEMMNP